MNRRLKQRPSAKRLRIEGLESRRVLATFTVNVDFDEVVTSQDGSFAGSLRQMIVNANQTPGPDEIVFDLPAGSNTITLTEGELVVTDAVTIDGSGVNGTLGWENLTIDANGDSRIFNVASTGAGDYRIADLSMPLRKLGACGLAA